MTSESYNHSDGKKYIKFTTDLVFKEYYGNFKPFFGFIADKFKYSCNYLKTGSTNDQEFGVVLKQVSSESVDAFTSWDSQIRLGFYAGDDFITPASGRGLILTKISK